MFDKDKGDTSNNKHQIDKKNYRYKYYRYYVTISTMQLKSYTAMNTLIQFIIIIIIKGLDS